MSQITLTFSSSNYRHTYIKPSGESLRQDVYYKVSTSGKTPNEVTSIYRLFKTPTSSHTDSSASEMNNEGEWTENKLIAAVEWRFPKGDDILRLGGSDASPQKLDKWLKRSVLVTNPRTFTAVNNVSYKWIQENKGFAYKLYPKDRVDLPMASVGISDSCYQLVIEPRGQEIMDEIVISFVMILNEKRLVEEAFLDQTMHAFDMSDSKILSWGRQSKTILSRFSNSTGSEHSADTESIYASSTTGLLRG